MEFPLSFPPCSCHENLADIETLVLMDDAGFYDPPFPNGEGRRHKVLHTCPIELRPAGTPRSFFALPPVVEQAGGRYVCGKAVLWGRQDQDEMRSLIDEWSYWDADPVSSFEVLPYDLLGPEAGRHKSYRRQFLNDTVKFVPYWSLRTRWHFNAATMALLLADIPPADSAAFNEWTFRVSATSQAMLVLADTRVEEYLWAGYTYGVDRLNVYDWLPDAKTFFREGFVPTGKSWLEFGFEEGEPLFSPTFNVSSDLLEDGRPEEVQDRF